MEEYKPNSHKSKEAKAENTPDKKVEKVVTGSVTTKKKNNVSKFADVFITEDIQNVKSYILLDVLLPSLKKAISDIVTNGIDILLYGESGRNKKTSSASKVSYRSYYDKGNDRRENASARVRNGFDYDDLIFNTRGDAELVLSSMDEAIEKYGVVSVGDLYDLADVTTRNYMVHEYGWTNIRSASVIRVKDGYMIKLPRAVPLN